MKTIAIASMKGGVGKTSIAVNLAWMSAQRSRRRTLLWDLDSQGGASFILGSEPVAGTVRDIFMKDATPASRIRATDVEGLDLLAADDSLRDLDVLFSELDRRKRLRKLIDGLGERYDRVILDCAPGLGATSAQILRAASLVVVPVVPNPLARRGLDMMRTAINVEHKGKPAILPVFSMVDKRKTMHREALEAEPDWPVIPSSALVERMAEKHAALAEYALAAPVTVAMARLWEAAEAKLAQIK